MISEGAHCQDNEEGVRGTVMHGEEEDAQK